MRNLSEKLLVWDLATRSYHWLQFLLVMGALLIGFFGPEWFLDAHVYAGYGVLALIVFRLVWGFAGPTYSRFSSFIFSPREVLRHVRGVLRGRPSHHLGHNPLGALMVFALIGVLLLMLASGLVVLGGVENQGPLAGFVGFDLGVRARLVHKVFAYLLVGMIVLHVAGVALESRLSGFSLVRSMVDGRKPRPEIVTGMPDETGQDGESDILGQDEFPRNELPQVPVRTGRAVLALIVSGVVIVGAGVLGSAVPASGFIDLPPNDNFSSECAECHMLYHPSLLPRDSWQKLMANLEDHFGEDASLDDSVTQDIANYLSTYSSEAWDTEAANELRAVDPQKPYEITATPFWKRTHARIDPTIFETRPVLSKSNCAACHWDAESGRFADQKIEIAHGQK